MLFGSFIDSLIRESGEIDIYVVRGDSSEATESSPVRAVRGAARGRMNFGGYALALIMVGAVTLLGIPLFAGLEVANIAMIYLASVVLAALWLGRGPAILTALSGVAAFDFCFVAPRGTFAVTDVQYLLTFGVMLAVGVIVGTLAARTREQTRAAWARERTTAAQYASSRELAAARDLRQVAAIVARHTHDQLGVDVVVCTPARRQGQPGPLAVLASAGAPDWFSDADERERSVAQWAFDHGRPAGCGTPTLPSSVGRYSPLIGSSGKVGLVGIRLGDSVQLNASQIATLDALATQAASALERVALSESEQAARIDAERERLRGALLSSVSHDLRTPLAGITGAASALDQAGSISDVTRADLLRTIITESSRLNDIIANLVFATRLESGAIELRREWTTLEEVIGVGLSRHRDALDARPFGVHLSSNLPMLRVDNAMLPQVIHNLVENALRYTGAEIALGISAWATEGNLVVKVWDEGPGLAEDESSKVFERFYRGRASRPTATDHARSSSAGMGLGLTICDGIIRAHGGRIWAEPNTPRGVAFLFSLPIDLPQPSLPPECESADDYDNPERPPSQGAT